MKQKQCRKCLETKPVSEFYKHAKTKDGLQIYCVSCARDVRRQWNEANKERKAEVDRQWKEANPKRDAYRNQKSNAKRRGVEFLLTFEEWRDWWGKDFAGRGSAKGRLVMARYGDKGPYQLGNIKKITCSENARESNGRRESKDQILLEV